MNPKSRTRHWAIAFLSALLLTGCENMNLDWLKKKETPVEPKPEVAPKQDPILADTIGQKVLLGDAAPIRLRGFGVVVGLGDRGGGDAPTAVREYLTDYLGKEAASARSGGKKWPSPQKLLDSPDSAIVAVYGLINAGAVDGAPFDVQVEALGTQTQSLEGGILLPAELKIWDVSASGSGLVAGRTLAKARGPIFTNPFVKESAKSGERRGWVLSGGRTIEERGFRLMLEEPSYTTARRIQDRLNERFSQSPKIATAQSQGYVAVRTPPAFADRPDRFIELANHVLLVNDPGFVERRVQDLIGQVGSAGARMNSISLMWEAMGRTILPQIQPLYAHSDPSVAFYAAQAGLRLKDVSAFPVVAAAATSGGPHRLLAVRELGRCGLVQAGARLAPLINGDDQELRIAAYEALLELRHPSVRTARFPHPVDPAMTNLYLDIVTTTGKPLVYFRQTREPRIAIFGVKLPVKRPLFYTHPLDWVTINAKGGSDDLTVFCRTRQSNRLSSTLKVPPQVSDLVRALAAPPIADDSGSLKGLGLPYALVVQVLDALCKQDAIPARLVVESTPTVDLLGAPAPIERPETEADVSTPPSTATKPLPEAKAETPAEKAAKKDRPE